MSAKRAISIGLTATSLTLFVPSAEGSRGDGEEPVVDAVREATARFRNVATSLNVSQATMGVFRSLRKLFIEANWLGVRDDFRNWLVTAA
jgi:hypothetical protein